MSGFDLLVRGTSEVVTASDRLASEAERALAPIARGAVGVTGGAIAFLGPEASLPKDSVGPATRVIDAGGGFVGPGFVDPHTHLVFAGERSQEFELRNRGAAYLEIASAGGGIMSTVRATRAASEDELVALALPRLRRLLEQGVTTAEAKSGYGLNLDDELRMLRAIRRLGAAQPIELLPTLLCAHAIPDEHRDTREQYVALCADEIIPAAAQHGLARFCDAFVEDGAFTPDEARRIAAAARKAGLALRLHVDQLKDGAGALLAAELQAISADHLEHVTSVGIAALAKARVVATLMPVSSLFVHAPKYAPGRALRDAGVSVALATNLNPGSAMTENVALTLGLACLCNGLTAAEAYLAFTRGAAQALALPHAGKLALGGGPADLVVFSADSYRHLPYHLGVSHVRAVVKAGKLVYEAAFAGLCRS